MSAYIYIYIYIYIYKVFFVCCADIRFDRMVTFYPQGGENDVQPWAPNLAPGKNPNFGTDAAVLDQGHVVRTSIKIKMREQCRVRSLAH
jgi:hypothetical protein